MTPTPPPQSAPQQPRSAPRLPRTVILLGWVSFFADVSSEMVYSLIPLFVVGVLGVGATTMGGIEGAAALIVAFATAWAGWRSDLWRRVPFVRVGYGLPVVGKALLAAATAWPMVLTGRLVDRLGKGLRSSPRDALIADATPAELRGRAFGLHRAMDTAGALVGVLLAAALMWWLAGTAEASATSPAAHSVRSDDARAYRIVFGVAAGLGLISLALTFMVRDSGSGDASRKTAQTGECGRPAHTGGPDDRAGGPEARTPHGASPMRPGFAPAYWKTVGVMLLFSLANSSDTFLLLRVRDVGVSAWGVVLAYALYNIVYAVLAYPAGALSDRLGRWRVIGVGWAVYTLVYAGFAWSDAASIWPLLALYGGYMALTDGVGKALVVDHAPKSRRGTALGVYHLASGLVSLLASVAAGVLWDRAGAAAMFLFGAACAGSAAMLALWPEKRIRTRSASERPERSGP
ncbi:major facilitator superfamily transporter [Phycisphaerae bacterium RAS1]|nr:major facilitator superfamily transporter [Phycisphaerae bacterium RAS1]